MLRRPLHRPPRLALALLGLLALPLGPRTAAAYILPADFLARLLADGHKSALKDISMLLSVEVPEGAPPQEERLYLKRPERMRFVAAPQSETVVIVREGQQATFTAKKLMAQGPADNLLAVFMLPRGRDLDETSGRILGALAQVGVDPNVVALGRHPDGVAYILGAQAWQPERPQVWLDKTSYMPVKVRLPKLPAAKDPVVQKPVMRETRYLNYAAGLPRLIEEYEDDRLIRRAEVTQVSINQNLPETLFDPREGRAFK